MRGWWLALLASLPAPAFAQRPISPGNVAPGSPSIASPLPGDVLPQGSPIPRVLPALLPSVKPGPGVPTALPGSTPAGAVAIRSVRVDGVSAYAAAQVSAITAGLAGAAVPLARIEAARTGLLNLYRGDGFALTTVTATVEPGGALRFDVVEGRIAAVTLDGDIGPAGAQVLRFLRHLTELRPIDTASLERWLLLAQDIPGVTVRAVLQPSAGEPGALTLVAQIERKAVSGLLNLDNRGSRFTGPLESLALLDFNSFSQFGERTELNLYRTEGDTQNFGQVTTEAFLGGSGLRGRLYGGHGAANPSGFLRDVRYHGATTVFGGSLAYPLIRSRQETLNLNGYFDAIETRVTQVAPTASGIQRGFDSLRVVRLGADYARQDVLAGDTRPAISVVNVRLSQGIPGLGATASAAADATRPGERVDFTKLVLDLSRVQTLLHLGADSSIALKGRLIGQFSDQILPPSEKLYLGGPEYTRGFYSGEVTGDRGLVWQAELQFNQSYDVDLFDRALNLAAQFYAFYDHGEVWQNQSRQLERPGTRLSSLGLGVRLNLTNYTELNLEAVHRNTRAPAGSAVSPLKADAVYWRAIARF